MGSSRVFFIIIMWLAPSPFVKGVGVASSQIMVVKTRRSTLEWHNMCVWTLIEVILMPLGRYLCVDYKKKGVTLKWQSLTPKKHCLMPQNSPRRFLA